jgi:hypothetical protein
MQFTDLLELNWAMDGESVNHQLVGGIRPIRSMCQLLSYFFGVVFANQLNANAIFRCFYRQIHYSMPAGTQTINLLATNCSIATCSGIDSAL